MPYQFYAVDLLSNRKYNFEGKKNRNDWIEEAPKTRRKITLKEYRKTRWKQNRRDVNYEGKV